MMSAKYSLLEILGIYIATAPFTLKLILGELLFAGSFRKREGFIPRLLLSFLLQLVIGASLYLLLRESDWWVISNTLYYLLLFVLSALFLKLPFKQPLGDLIPCAVGGYIAEHVSTQVFNLIFYKLETSLRGGETYPGYLLLFIVGQMLIFFLVSGSLWYLFARRATPMDMLPGLKKRTLRLSAVTLLVVLVLSSARDQYASESFRLMVITRLFSIFCCLFLLYIRYDMMENARLEAERAQLASLMEMEKKQYELSRENIELINIKCHDMRHKIDLWQREGASADKEEIAEIRRMIDIYDRSIRTGNEVLDTILTERSLYCEKEGIRLSCMADGEKLGFLSTGDLCALFGNAIENAIEAVKQVPEEDNRSISLQVRGKRGMLIITVENSFVGEIHFEDGLPQSSKGDDKNHGFGTRSIRNVAEKYGGEMSIQAEDCFRLTVLLPLPVEG